MNVCKNQFFRVSHRSRLDHGPDCRSSSGGKLGKERHSGPIESARFWLVTMSYRLSAGRFRPAQIRPPFYPTAILSLEL
jgi:hypothetical protein